MSTWLDTLINDVEVWIAFLFGVVTFVVYARQLRRPYVRNRVVIWLIIALALWLMVGYAVLGINLTADEAGFSALWLRPAHITLLATVASLGIGERRHP